MTLLGLWIGFTAGTLITIIWIEIVNNKNEKRSISINADDVIKYLSKEEVGKFADMIEKINYGRWGDIK